MTDFVPLKCGRGGGSSNEVSVAIISLDDARDRRSALKRIGLPEAWLDNYWNACDLRNADADVVMKGVNEKAFLNHYHRQPLPGEIGCTRSHYSALEEFVNSTQSEYLLMLEDDIEPASADVCADVQGIINLLSSVSGTNFVCHLGPGEVQRRLSLCRRVRSDGDSVKVNLHLDKQQSLWLSHAYIIGREAAQNYLIKQSPIQYICDDWRRMKIDMGFNLFFVEEPLFVQSDAFESSISVDKALRAAPKMDFPSMLLRLAKWRGLFFQWIKRQSVALIKRLWLYPSSR